LSYEQVGDLDEARSSYFAATTLGPEGWLNWNALGAFLIRTGESERAREMFLEAASRTPAQVTEPQQNLA
jgi:Flp pilus assembly protein TadD